MAPEIAAALVELMLEVVVVSSSRGGGGIPTGGVPGGAASGPQGVAPVSNGYILPSRPTHEQVVRWLASGRANLRRVAEEALAAIDRVHQDGLLPQIPVEGFYQARTPNAGRLHVLVSNVLDPDRLTLNLHPDCMPTAKLTFAHETGHFLDLSAIGGPGRFASASGHVFMAGWDQAVNATNTVQTLRRNGSLGRVELRMPDGSLVGQIVDRRYTDYLLQPEEIWARSYAQYIAERSADPDMLAALDLLRPPALTGRLYQSQWETTDFAPVATAIDTLFTELGWIP